MILAAFRGGPAQPVRRGMRPFLWQNFVTMDDVLVITAWAWLNWMLASPMSRSDITITAVLALAGSADRAAKRN